MNEVPLGKIDIKVSGQESSGNILVVEMTHHARGGPGLHVHHDQDEWFFVHEGEYILEVGGVRRVLAPGDSCFGPRQVPHAWSFVGGTLGRIVFVFAPAGRMEAFFRTIRQAGTIPGNDPALFRSHGMELIGPPL
jgi:mannose-6-phosphate isomerase-like protein (cupin superfamily)